MPRRGRFIQYGAIVHAPPGKEISGGCYEPPAFKYSEVPEAWREHAREPWRILFPDLDWSPTGREDYSG